jgi:hypothetical protein
MMPGLRQVSKHIRVVYGRLLRRHGVATGRFSDTSNLAFRLLTADWLFDKILRSRILSIILRGL